MNFIFFIYIFNVRLRPLGKPPNVHYNSLHGVWVAGASKRLSVKKFYFFLLRNFYSKKFGVQHTREKCARVHTCQIREFGNFRKFAKMRTRTPRVRNLCKKVHK
jgi:hypothetical protein